MLGCDQALVRVEAAPRSAAPTWTSRRDDWAIIDRPPMLGHEFAGTVVEVGQRRRHGRRRREPRHVRDVLPRPTAGAHVRAHPDPGVDRTRPCRYGECRPRWSSGSPHQVAAEIATSRSRSETPGCHLHAVPARAWSWSFCCSSVSNIAPPPGARRWRARLRPRPLPPRPRRSSSGATVVDVSTVEDVPAGLRTRRAGRRDRRWFRCWAPRPRSSTRSASAPMVATSSCLGSRPWPVYIQQDRRTIFSANLTVNAVNGRQVFADLVPHAVAARARRRRPPPADQPRAPAGRLRAGLHAELERGEASRSFFTRAVPPAVIALPAEEAQPLAAPRALGAPMSATCSGRWPPSSTRCARPGTYKRFNTLLSPQGPVVSMPAVAR